MTAASISFSRRPQLAPARARRIARQAPGSVLRALLWLAALLLGAALALPAAAHKASDAYLLLDAQGPSAKLRIDIALRDLDAALDIDSDGDARLTWAEVRTALPAIEAYAMQRIEVVGCAAKPASRALEQRNDGVYAALTWALACELTAAPQLRYHVLREVDATHRGLLRIRLPGQAPTLRVLDPTAVTADLAEPQVAGRTVGGGVTVRPVEMANPPAPEPERVAQGMSPSSSSSTGFVAEGMRHILTGWDHALFLVCLLLPSVMQRTAQGWRPVARFAQALWPVACIVTSFTLAHSITLTLAALNVVALPSSFIEPAIAATIVLAALDNVRPIFFGRRGLVTFGFGLIHGFGFAGVLSELELPTAQFAWALLQFNVGLELGQLAIVILAAGLLFALRRQRIYPALAIRGGSFAAIAIGALWLVERIADVSLLPL